MANAPFNLPESHPLDVARRLLHDQGKIIPTLHAIERMAERRILPAHVERVLRHGTLDPDPGRIRFDEEYGEWSYAVIGRDLDGRRIRVVFALIAPDVLLITAVDLTRSPTATRR